MIGDTVRTHTIKSQNGRHITAYGGPVVGNSPSLNDDNAGAQLMLNSATTAMARAPSPVYTSVCS